MTDLILEKINIIIDKTILDEIPSYMQTKTSDNERGGILMGQIYPDTNTIVVTKMFESKKAKSSRYNVKIDSNEMQMIINKIHKESNGTISYLGDWHTHPEAIPKPSSNDMKSFQDIITKSKLGKNVLVNLIIGNNINKDYLYLKTIEKY